MAVHKTLARRLQKKLRAGLRPAIARVGARLLARLGFPTNPSGNNMSMR